MTFGEGTTSRDTRNDYCYRHPNRQSFVLCQRCGRTICGDCQTPGPVGVICPECMKQQRAAAPRVKSRVLTATSGTPVVTYALIGVCVAVYILQWIPGLDVTSRVWWAGLYSYPGAFEAGGVLYQGSFEPWRMITSMFAHSQSFIFHILLNMYMLWILGRMIEPALGRARFLTLYLMSGVGGSLGVLLLSDPRVPTIGASGAIFGLMGAFFVIQRRLGGNAVQLLVLIGINLVIGFLPGLHIAWQAHLGGLVVGALVGFILVETRSRARHLLQLGLLIAVGAALVAASFIHWFV